MKKLSGLALILASCVILSACGGGTNNGTASGISGDSNSMVGLSGESTSVYPAKPEIPDVPVLSVSELEYELISGPNGSGIQINAINSETEDVRFPDTIDGEPVLYISDDLQYYYKVKNLIFPDSVTYCGTIPRSVEFVKLPQSLDCENNDFPSFSYNSELKEVWIPDGITKMSNERGNGLFDNCTSLKSISLPAGLTEIGRSMFYECGSLESVYIPDSVTTIEESAFNGCLGLTSISIPDSVTKMGDMAFYRCESLVSADLGSGITEIGSSTFSYCYSLSDVKLGNNITNIGPYAFDQCTSLTNIDLPADLTELGEFAFDSCTSLTSIVIPNKVTYIQSGTFGLCENLATVTLPDSLEKIRCELWDTTTIIYKGKKYTSTEDEQAFRAFWDDNDELF